MKKNDQNPSGTAHDEIAHSWKELIAALRNVTDGALNAASKLSSYEEEWDAIENVREFLYDWLDGRAAYVKLTDLLIVLATILSAIEIELGIDSAELLEPLRTMLEMPSYLPAVIRLPGAFSPDKPTAVIRRIPRRRNAAAPFIHLAA